MGKLAGRPQVGKSECVPFAKALVLVAAVVGAGLGGCTTPCDATTCSSGCCDGAGECQVGATSRLACGEGGGRCVACEAGWLCRQHACVEAPVVDDRLPDGGRPCVCTQGCCLADGTCDPGNLNLACGRPLEFCVACSSSQRCMGGACFGASCAGCIDAAGSCREGSALTACGVNGALCLGCLVDEVCLEGVCVKPGCNQSSCGGCCTPAGVCQPLPGTEAWCGVAGAQCRPCTGGMRCDAGRCQ
jgi:hypothetical protein